MKSKVFYQVDPHNRLSYILDKEIGSGFNFRISFKEKKIERKITFHARWKLAKDKKIFLELSPNTSRGGLTLRW